MSFLPPELSPPQPPSSAPVGAGPTARHQVAATQVYRCALLRFDEQGQVGYESDGLLVVRGGLVVASGSWQALHAQWVRAAGEPGHAAAELVHLPGRIIAPGFVDLHVHFPQTDVIGSRADGLLPWLTEHTFPHEARFADGAYARAVAAFFLEELLRNGVTTASVFCTSHVASVDAFFTEAAAKGMRMVAGKCLQDSHSPDGVRDETEQSLLDTEALIARWHSVGRLGYAITPRFAPSCSAEQLRGAGELAARHPSVWVQSHVAESLDEIAWARSLFPGSGSYLGIYDDFGLLRQRSIYAHCIHFDDADRALMRSRGAVAAVCPTSNQFLGSGNFDFFAANAANMCHGLASDVGGGMSFSPFATMRAAYVTARSDALVGGSAKAGTSLSAEYLWWLHTDGAARGMGLKGQIGSLAVGSEADFIVLNPHATPILSRKVTQANSLDELLFSIIMLADDRAVEKTAIANLAAP